MLETVDVLSVGILWTIWTMVQNPRKSNFYIFSHYFFLTTFREPDFNITYWISLKKMSVVRLKISFNQFLSSYTKYSVSYSWNENGSILSKVLMCFGVGLSFTIFVQFLKSGTYSITAVQTRHIWTSLNLLNYIIWYH